MKTRGAILRAVPGEYEIAELDLDEPRHGELMIKMVAAGMCHSDDHIASGDTQVGHLPMCGGHEGAGVVVQVGPETYGWSEETTSSSPSSLPADAAVGVRRACRTSATAAP